MIQCKNKLDFAQFNLGDKVEAKVLDISTQHTGHGARQWLELTRAEAHLKQPTGLNSEALATLIKSQDELKVGEKYRSMIVSCSNEKA